MEPTFSSQYPSNKEKAGDGSGGTVAKKSPSGGTPVSYRTYKRAVGSFWGPWQGHVWAWPGWKAEQSHVATQLQTEAPGC